MSKDLLDPWKRIFRFVMLGNTGRKKLNFLHWNVCIFSFFQIILFSTTYRVYENWPLHLHQICLNTLWGVIDLPWTSAKLDITSKILKVYFFTGKVTFFRKVVFPTFTQLLQKRFFKLHNSCLNLFWANGNASWCRHTR